MNGGKLARDIHLLVVSLVCAGTVIADDTAIILPQALEWSYSLEVGGEQKRFLLPNELTKIKALPSAQRQGVIEDILRIEKNQEWVRRIGLDFTSLKPGSGGRLSPDYERTLGDVAFSVSHAEITDKNPVWRQLPILKALPPYSRIHLVLPPAAEPAVRRALAPENLLARTDFHLIQTWGRDKGEPTKYTRATRWIRDTVMVGSSQEDQKSVIYLPLAYATTSDLRQNDLAFFKTKWRKNTEVVPFPAFLRGGNVLVADNLAGERVAVVGHDEIEQNELRYGRSTSMKPPREQIGEIVKRIAGTDKLHVLPNTNRLFHIDMAMSFIRPGVVALISPIDEEVLGRDEALALAHYRKVLLGAGFRIIDIPTTTERINNYQSPVNILPFIVRNTWQRRAIAPEYGDVAVTVDGRRQSLNGLIRKAYDDIGLSISWVEDRLSTQLGSVHCAALGLN